MNGMTLEALRNAMMVILTAKRFKTHPKKNDVLRELSIAKVYMTGEDRSVTPRDPREVLAEIGFKL